MFKLFRYMMVAFTIVASPYGDSFFNSSFSAAAADEPFAEPAELMRFSIFETALRTRDKYSKNCVPHDALCQIAIINFEGTQIYFANLVPKNILYDPNDAVVGSTDILNLLTNALNETIFHFEIISPNKNVVDFLLSGIYSIPKEAFSSCMGLFARHYGLSERDTSSLIAKFDSRMSRYKETMKRLNLVLDQARQIFSDALIFDSEQVSYQGLIQRLNNSHPFGNSVRPEIPSMFREIKYKEALFSLCGYLRPSAIPGNIRFSAVRISSRPLADKIDVSLFPLKGTPDAYVFVRNLILGHESNIVARILEKFIEAPWLEAYMREYESTLEQIEKLNALDMEIKQLPNPLSLFYGQYDESSASSSSSSSAPPFTEENSYQNICQKFYGGSSILGYMSFPEQFVPPVFPETRCRVYSMNIGDLSRKLTLTDENVQHIKDNSVVLVQRTDIFGPGTRYFSSPDMQLLKQKIAVDTAEAGPVIAEEVQQYVMDQEIDVSEEFMIFMATHLDDFEKLGQWATFEEFTRARAKDIPAFFRVFGKGGVMQYSEVRKMFLGLDVLG